MSDYRENNKRTSRKPYRAEPEKNKLFTEEQVKEMKRRATKTRRELEDERIDKELGLD